MKVGQEVNYYDPDHGERQDATIVDITGAGESTAKVLTLQVGDKEVKSVAHGGDADVNEEAFWLIKGQESAPRGWPNKKSSKKKK